MKHNIKLPPHYVNVSTEVAFNNDLPDAIFRTLVQVHGLAWETKGERTPPATILELATLRGLKERRMYDHLRELKEGRFIRIDNLGDGRIVIYPLRWIDDTGAALSAASSLTPAELAALEEDGGGHTVTDPLRWAGETGTALPVMSTAKNCSATATEDCSATAIQGNNVVVAVDSVSEHRQQQQHLNNLSTAKNCSNNAGAMERLIDFGVEEDVAHALAETNTLDQINAWIVYANKASSLRDPVAFVVARLKAGKNPPKNRKQHDRHRYIEGKYADYIQH